MSHRLAQHELHRLAVGSPAVRPDAVLAKHTARTDVDRNFGLPTGLYVATVGLYLAFIGLMASVFMNPELAIPMVIFAGFVVMAFGLAACWAKMRPENETAPLNWSTFAERGIDTLSGRLTAGEASIQVLILPVLILAWGIAIAVIVALN